MTITVTKSEDSDHTAPLGTAGSGLGLHCLSTLSVQKI